MADLSQGERETSDQLLHDALAGGHLPRWSTPAVAVGALVGAVILNLTTGVAGVVQPVWLVVQVPKDVAPGTYTGTVTVTNSAGR